MKNPKIFYIALAALVTLVLTFTHHWLWILPTVLLTGYNWKLMYEK